MQGSTNRRTTVQAGLDTKKDPISKIANAGLEVWLKW
jgi:hypothetical protein